MINIAGRCIVVTVTLVPTVAVRNDFGIEVCPSVLGAEIVSYWPGSIWTALPAGVARSPNSNRLRDILHGGWNINSFVVPQ